MTPTEENRDASDRLLGRLAVVGTEASASAAMASAYTDNLSVVVGAAGVPIVTGVVEAVVERRASTFRQRLTRAGITPDLLAEKIIRTPAIVDLIAASTAAALATDMEEKRALLANYLGMAVLDADTRDLALDRRVISCFARIDALEVRVLDTMRSSGLIRRSELSDLLGKSTADVLDTVVAVLVSEGLVFGALDDGLRVSGFGMRVLGELASAQRGATSRGSEPN